MELKANLNKYGIKGRELIIENNIINIIIENYKKEINFYKKIFESFFSNYKKLSKNELKINYILIQKNSNNNLISKNIILKEKIKKLILKFNNFEKIFHTNIIKSINILNNLKEDNFLLEFFLKERNNLIKIFYTEKKYLENLNYYKNDINFIFNENLKEIENCLKKELFYYQKKLALDTRKLNVEKKNNLILKNEINKFIYFLNNDEENNIENNNNNIKSINDKNKEEVDIDDLNEIFFTEFEEDFLNDVELNDIDNITKNKNDISFENKINNNIINNKHIRNIQSTGDLIPKLNFKLIEFNKIKIDSNLIKENNQNEQNKINNSDEKNISLKIENMKKKIKNIKIKNKKNKKIIIKFLNFNNKYQKLLSNIEKQIENKFKKNNIYHIHINSEYDLV